MASMRIHTSILGCLALAALGSYSPSDAHSVEAPALATARPMLAVEGTLRNDVSADLIGFAYDDQTGGIEFTLANWANGDFKYSEGTLFRHGITVAVHVGSGAKPPRLVEGRVTELAPNFPGGALPTITIRAAASRQPATSASELQVSYGTTLTEFYPVQKADGSITCNGTLSNVNDLVRGMTLRVGGVGPTFSGRYLVSSTVHSFDPSKGLRTTFTATKTAATRLLPSAKRSG